MKPSIRHIAAQWHNIRASWYVAEHLLSNRKLKKIIANNAGYKAGTLLSIPPCFFGLEQQNIVPLKLLCKSPFKNSITK